MTNARRQTIGYSPTSSRAVYPAPDMATARLVDKLRQRGASNPQMARASSSALIEDEYELAGGGMRAEPAPRFDNNYSPYSSVNAEAVAEARRRAEEKKRMEAMAARARAASAQAAPRVMTNTLPAPRPQSAAHPAPRTAAAAAVKRQAAKPVPARRSYGEGQLAESGPREVAQRRVPFPKLAIVIVFLFLVLFFMVQGFVRNYELRQRVTELQGQVAALSELQGQVAALSERESLLKSALEERDDYGYIEEQAEALGMVKVNQMQEQYIDLSGEDVIENFGGQDGEPSTFSTMLSAISRRLSRFLGGE